MFSLFIWGKLAAGAASPPYGEGMMEIELDRVLLGRRVAVIAFGRLALVTDGRPHV